MIEKDLAEAFVTAYIRDWHEAWASVQERFKSQVDFEVWRKVVGAIDAVHFVSGAGSGSADSYRALAEHDPDGEKLVGFVSDGPDAARVETQDSGFVTSYWEYELVLVGGELKLTKLRRHFEPKGTPVIDPEVATKLLEAPT